MGRRTWRGGKPGKLTATQRPVKRDLERFVPVINDEDVLIGYEDRKPFKPTPEKRMVSFFYNSPMTARIHGRTLRGCLSRDITSLTKRSSVIDSKEPILDNSASIISINLPEIESIDVRQTTEKECFDSTADPQSVSSPVNHIAKRTANSHLVENDDDQEVKTKEPPSAIPIRGLDSHMCSPRPDPELIAKETEQRESELEFKEYKKDTSEVWESDVTRPSMLEATSMGPSQPPDNENLEPVSDHVEPSSSDHDEPTPIKKVKFMINQEKVIMPQKPLKKLETDLDEDDSEEDLVAQKKFPKKVINFEEDEVTDPVITGEHENDKIVLRKRDLEIFKDIAVIPFEPSNEINRSLSRQIRRLLPKIPYNRNPTSRDIVPSFQICQQACLQRAIRPTILQGPLSKVAVPHLMVPKSVLVRSRGQSELLPVAPGNVLNEFQLFRMRPKSEWGTKRSDEMSSEYSSLKKGPLIDDQPEREQKVYSQLKVDQQESNMENCGWNAIPPDNTIPSNKGNNFYIHIRPRSFPLDSWRNRYYESPDEVNVFRPSNDDTMMNNYAPLDPVPEAYITVISGTPFCDCRKVRSLLGMNLFTPGSSTFEPQEEVDLVRTQEVVKKIAESKPLVRTLFNIFQSLQQPSATAIHRREIEKPDSFKEESDSDSSSIKTRMRRHAPETMRKIFNSWDAEDLLQALGPEYLPPRPEQELPRSARVHRVKRSLNENYGEDDTLDKDTDVAENEVLSSSIGGLLKNLEKDRRIRRRFPSLGSTFATNGNTYEDSRGRTSNRPVLRADERSDNQLEFSSEMTTRTPKTRADEDMLWRLFGSNLDNYSSKDVRAIILPAKALTRPDATDGFYMIPLKNLKNCNAETETPSFLWQRDQHEPRSQVRSNSRDVKSLLMTGLENDGEEEDSTVTYIVKEGKGYRAVKAKLPGMETYTRPLLRILETVFRNVKLRKLLKLREKELESSKDLLQSRGVEYDRQKFRRRRTKRSVSELSEKHDVGVKKQNPESGPRTQRNIEEGDQLWSMYRLGKLLQKMNQQSQGAARDVTNNPDYDVSGLQPTNDIHHLKTISPVDIHAKAFHHIYDVPIDRVKMAEENQKLESSSFLGNGKEFIEGGGECDSKKLFKRPFKKRKSLSNQLVLPPPAFTKMSPEYFGSLRGMDSIRSPNGDNSKLDDKKLVYNTIPQRDHPLQWPPSFPLMQLKSVAQTPLQREINEQQVGEDDEEMLRTQKGLVRPEVKTELKQTDLLPTLQRQQNDKPIRFQSKNKHLLKKFPGQRLTALSSVPAGQDSQSERNVFIDDDEENVQNDRPNSAQKKQSKSKSTGKQSQQLPLPPLKATSDEDEEYDPGSSTSRFSQTEEDDIVGDSAFEEDSKSDDSKPLDHLEVKDQQNSGESEIQLLESLVQKAKEVIKGKSLSTQQPQQGLEDDEDFEESKSLAHSKAPSESTFGQDFFAPSSHKLMLAGSRCVAGNPVR
ncbi:unnamed protein product [Cyprideis torosa]|uniref:Uncharacterized protein n=1 Tax=Cyprideis torosa TaxID=163714 RepID=A0A7R8ZNK4_9CRUS|nr:unnamed protein product [Cyprideis torosa]CAG0891767.1 unnamed protein product [Cyprideis torosa]